MYRSIETDYYFLKGLTKQCFEMAEEIDQMNLSELLKIGENCLIGIPGEALPVGNMNIYIMNNNNIDDKIYNKWEKNRFKEKKDRVHVITTNYEKVLLGLFMLLAEVLHARWNGYVSKFNPQVFDYIMSLMFYFLKKLEEDFENFEEKVKETFFRFLHKIINTEIKMYDVFEPEVPENKYMN